MIKKTKNMKYNIPVLILFLLLTAYSFAEDFKKEREITKTFLINKDTEIQINNKYGNIQVINWEKDSVMIQIEISVIGNKLSKVNKTFDYIDVDFSANTHYIIVNTIFKNDRNNFWTDISDITNSIFKGGNNTHIDYTIFMSENNPLRIKNKFGNIYLTNRTRNTEIDLSNGDFKANDISGYLEMDFSYGSASIKNASKANIKIHYGDIRIDKINELSLDSRSSTIDCDEINDLNIISKRDKFFLGNVNTIDGGFSFSNLQIDYLAKNIILDTNFGDLTIDELSNDFTNINLNSSNTDISLIFEQASSYTIDLSYTKRSTVNLPNNYKDTKVEHIGKNDEDTRIRANSGSNPTRSKVNINQKSGSIRIVNK